MDVIARLKFLFIAVILSLFLASGEKTVSVSETELDSAVDDIQWFRSDHKHILCRTIGGKLYRSVDNGRSWRDITTALETVSSSSAEGNSSSSSESSKDKIFVRQIIAHPKDKDVVLIACNKHRHFISNDGGIRFTEIAHTGTMHHFIFHPKRSNYALMSSWTPACEKAKKGKDRICKHELYATTDFGQTWKFLASHVVQYSWGDVAHQREDDVFLTYYTKGRRNNQPRSSGWSPDISFGVTNARGGSVKQVVSKGNKFLVSNGFIFVAQLLDETLQTVQLMVSKDGGVHFTAAELPVPLTEKSYTILDVSEDSVMLHVNHGHASEDGVASGNVYISDSSGVRYVLSLPRNVRTATGECEFDKVASLEGVYIANFKDSGNFGWSASGGTVQETRFNKNSGGDRTLSSDEEDEEEDGPDPYGIALNDENVDSFEETSVERRRKKAAKLEPYVRTVISFDKGAIWSYLEPPRVDSQGNLIDCRRTFDRDSPRKPASEVPVVQHPSAAERNTEGCYLHLHGVSSFHQYAPFYSVENAVGLIMGTGNVGPSLRYEEDAVNTYLSRDGGLTWIEAHKGAYIYEFGDHGGLTVMANDLKKTNQVVFSWNEGQSWYDFDLGDEPLDVDNIIIEPNSSSVEFLLYGTRGTAGVLYHLDFATLGQPQCRGANAADSVSSDYETWTPTDGRTGDKCMLGKSTVFTRRKQASECFNGQHFERPVLAKHCACSERDYQCEYGFTRDLNSFECHPDEDVIDFPGCTSGSLFYADAYRKVPGDKCQDGWKPHKVAVLCPTYSPFSKRAKMMLGTVLTVGVLLAFLTKYQHDERFQWLISPASDRLSTAKYAVLGGAARFVDAFNLGVAENVVGGVHFPFSLEKKPTAGVDAGCTTPFDDTDTNDGEDAPPLLDFSLARHDVGMPMEAIYPVDCGVHEHVPRLAPPNESTHQLFSSGDRRVPPGEFELL